MNPNIANLARLPRGTAWHSRLVPFDREIRRWREAGESYRKIAVALGNHGLRVSHSAVHSYVRVRALCKHPMYALPNQVLYYHAADEKSDKQQIAHPNNALAPTEGSAKQSAKKYVFRPDESSQIPLSDEDLTFNDPLTLN